MLSDIIGGFLVWLFRGRKTNLKDETLNHFVRNQLVTFFVIVGLALAGFIIIMMIT